MVKIKVGCLVSYDYDMLITSLNLLYQYVDRIYLAIDENRHTWSGNKFEIPNTFFEQIKLFDTQNKIEFYFDNFFIPELSPLENDTRERNMLLKKMGKGWLIQLDADEYIYDFKKLSKYLKRYWYLTLFPKLTPIAFKGKWVTLFKKIPEGFLYIDNNEEFSFVTNINEYDYVRNNYKIRNHYLNLIAIHQSWARTDNEIKNKIKNWGHRDDFDTQEYFIFWKNLDSSNYFNYKDFHPLNSRVWSQLKFLPSNSITDFIENYSKENRQKLYPINKKVMLKAIFKKIFK